MFTFCELHDMKIKRMLLNVGLLVFVWEKRGVHLLGGTGEGTQFFKDHFISVPFL